MLIYVCTFLAFPLPPNWDFQPIDCSTGKERDVHRFTIDKSDMEYDQIHDMFKGSLTTVLPNAEVVRIERIQNPRLHQIYEGQKKTMSNGGNEMRLFHGTAKTAVQNINTTGFNRSYCGKNGKVFTLVLVKRANLANSPISAHSAFAEKNRLGLDLFPPRA